MGKIDYLNKRYEDMEKQYGKLSEEEMKVKMQNETQKINKKIEGLQKAIEGIQDVNSKREEKISSTTDEKEKETLKSQINKAKEKIENHKKEITNNEKKIADIENYDKSKVQIQRIRTFKISIENRLSKEMQEKEKVEKNLEDAKKELEKVEKALAKNNDKKLGEIDQYEHNGLLMRKENAEKVIKDSKETLERCESKIMTLKGKIGKCNLAWKFLFQGKSWDEIERTAAKDNYTRKLDNKNSERTPINNKVEIEEKNGTSTKSQEPITGLPARRSKWDRLINWVKSIFTSKSKIEKKPVEVEKVEEVEKGDRDQFIEELRKYADKDYGKQVKAEKEKAYIEAHKAQPKKEEQTR